MLGRSILRALYLCFTLEACASSVSASGSTLRRAYPECLPTARASLAGDAFSKAAFPQTRQDRVVGTNQAFRRFRPTHGQKHHHQIGQLQQPAGHPAFKTRPWKISAHERLHNAQDQHADRARRDQGRRNQSPLEDGIPCIGCQPRAHPPVEMPGNADAEEGRSNTQTRKPKEVHPFQNEVLTLQVHEIMARFEYQEKEAEQNQWILVPWLLDRLVHEVNQSKPVLADTKKSSSGKREEGRV
mmetsp:Transcript_53401/g.110287  ORF Transcript_53401/g.110287 Transcript_53401/m.110287 type:complete len:242 (-) Transcript_53401:315-1040(-)